MMIRKEFPWINVTRGGSSTVLDDLRTLASSNILIASNSHFSALGGYLAPEDGIIIVDSNNVYFQPHKEIRSNVYTIESQELYKKLTDLWCKYFVTNTWSWNIIDTYNTIWSYLSWVHLIDAVKNELIFILFVSIYIYILHEKTKLFR